MKIRSTIIISFIAIGLITFSMSVTTLFVFSRIETSSLQTKDVLIKSFDETHAILYHLQDIGIYLLSEGSPNAINIMPELSPQQLMTEIDNHLGEFSKLIELSENTMSPEAESNLFISFQSARSKWQTFSSNYKTFLETLAETGEETKIQSINTNLLPDLKSIIVTLHEYQRLSMALSAQNQQHIRGAITKSSGWVKALGIGQLCLAFLGCWLACQLILKPLQSLVSTMERIQTGKTTVRFTYTGNNEIGYLARTFNNMVKRWHDSLTAQNKAERHLAKRKKLFEDLFEFAPDAMLMVDPKGTIHKVNRHGEIIFEWSRDDLIGQRFEVLLSENLHDQKPIKDNDHLNQVFMDYMGISGFKMKALTHGGKPFDAEMSFKTMETESGPMITVVIRDISQQV